MREHRHDRDQPIMIMIHQRCPSKIIHFQTTHNRSMIIILNIMHQFSSLLMNNNIISQFYHLLKFISLHLQHHNLYIIHLLKCSLSHIILRVNFMQYVLRNKILFNHKYHNVIEQVQLDPECLEQVELKNMLMEDKVDQVVVVETTHLTKIQVLMMNVKLAVLVLSNLQKTIIDEGCKMREMLLWTWREEECKKIWQKLKKLKDNLKKWLREKDRKNRRNYLKIFNKLNLVTRSYLSKDNNNLWYMAQNHKALIIMLTTLVMMNLMILMKEQLGLEDHRIIAGINKTKVLLIKEICLVKCLMDRKRQMMITQLTLAEWCTEATIEELRYCRSVTKMKTSMSIQIKINGILMVVMAQGLSMQMITNLLSFMETINSPWNNRMLAMAHLISVEI